MDLAVITEAVSLAEQRWPGTEFRIKGDEAHGPCPICGQADDDGFIIFDDGGFYCRPGDHAGWIQQCVGRFSLCFRLLDLARRDC